MSQISNESIIGALRDYYMQCPLLKDGHFNIDYLPNSADYSLETTPADPVYKEYTDGGKVYQIEYAFTSKQPFDGDARTMIDNSFFYQRLSEWIEEKDFEEDYPVIEGRQVISNRLLTGGYLFDADADLGKYQIQLRLLYE